MIVRTALLGATLALALTGVASAALLGIDADRVTLVRIPGAVPAKTCTVGAVADAHVDESLPDTNAGTAATVEVGAGPADRRAFVRFDLASCAIPAGADVRSAKLSAVLAAAPADPRTWNVHRATAAWPELGVTWNTAPAVAASATGTASIGTAAGATVEWSVLSDVAGIVSGATSNDGWRISDADEAPPAPIAGSLASREAAAAADRPTLTVTWFD